MNGRCPAGCRVYSFNSNHTNHKKGDYHTLQIGVRGAFLEPWRPESGLEEAAQG